MAPELQVYEAQLRWLLGQVEHIVESAGRQVLVAKPRGRLEGNNLLAIAKHGAAVTRAYALGIGSDAAVTRDRSTEFTADISELASIRKELRELPRAITSAFNRLDPMLLDAVVLPAQALYGEGIPRLMTRREAIVESIRHLGIHLGEMRLTQSILED